MPRKKPPPITPGEVLLEEFLNPLARYFGASDQDRLGARLRKEVRVLAEK